MTRSRPETACRTQAPRRPPGRSRAPAPATATGVTTVPGGRRTPSSPGPAAALEVGDQDHLARGQLRLLQDGLGRPSGPGRTGSCPSPPGAVSRALPEPRRIGGRPGRHAGALAEEHQAGAVQRPEVGEDGAGGGSRPAPCGRRRPCCTTGPGAPRPPAAGPGPARPGSRRAMKGRAKATARSASARARSSRRSQCWMRRRRCSWNGIFSRNMRDGNATTFRRCRRVRCRITGTAMPARPRRKSGTRKREAHRIRLSRSRAER